MTPQSAQGTGWTSALHPEDAERVYEEWSRFIEGKAPYYSNYRFRHPDGEVRWVIGQAAPVLNADGGIFEYIGTLTDITDRKRTEEELRESEKRLRILEIRFRTLIEQSPLGIVIYSPEGKVRFANEAVNKLHGITDAEAENIKKNYNILKDEQLESRGLMSYIKRGFSGEVSKIPAIRYDPKKTRAIQPFQEQQPHWLESTIYPVKDDLGNIVEVVLIHHDITERKKNEEERIGLEVQLRQAQKMEAIGTLAGGIAHDFNNILSIILGNTELALIDISEGNPAYHKLIKARAACLRAKDLVLQILAFSRQAELRQTPFLISSILKEGLKLLRSSLPTTIEIQQNIETQSAKVLADPTQIHQILLNLCTNAAHAMGEKGGILNVSLADEQLDLETASRFYDLSPGFFVRLTVNDNGSGIEPSIQERIFEPYFTTKELEEGTGMGLAVVHGIVKSCGGAITVESELGKGTTFHVLLPKFEGEISPVEETLAQLPGGAERILFVDDEDAMVDTIPSMLRMLGYEVESKKSSIECLNVFRDNPEAFDLLITDMTMPNITGVDLSKKVMKIRPDIPIILFTGFSELIDEKRAKEIGIRAFLMKPVIIQEIANTIREVLDKK